MKGTVEQAEQQVAQNKKSLKKPKSVIAFEVIVGFMDTHTHTMYRVW